MRAFALVAAAVAWGALLGSDPWVALVAGQATTAAAAPAVNTTTATTTTASAAGLGAWAGDSPDLTASVTGKALRFGSSVVAAVAAGDAAASLGANSCGYGPFNETDLVGISSSSPLVGRPWP